MNRSRAAYGLAVALALSSAVRESALSAVALMAAAWCVAAWFQHRHQWADRRAYRELRVVAWALVLYFVLHAIRLDSERGLARLDGPVRAVVMAPLLVLPWVAGLDWPRLRLLVGVAGVVQGLASLLAWALHPEWPRIFGFFTYHNLAAYAAVATVGMLACTRAPHGQAWLSRTAIVLGVVAALLTGTFGALLGLPLVAALALWRHRARLGVQGGRWPRSAVLGVMALATLVVVLTVWPRLEQRAQFVAENLQSQVSEAGFHGSGYQRLAMWRVCLAMIQDRPLQGHGLDAFPDQMQPWADRLGLDVRFGIEGFGYGGFRNPHQQFLGWAATLGLPSMLALILLFWAVPLRAAWRLWQGVSALQPVGTGSGGLPSMQPAVRAPEVREAVVALAVLLCLLALFCLTESVLERQRGITWFLCWTLLVVGSLAVSADGQSGDEQQAPDQRRPV